MLDIPKTLHSDRMPFDDSSAAFKDICIYGDTNDSLLVRMGGSSVVPEQLAHLYLHRIVPRVLLVFLRDDLIATTPSIWSGRVSKRYH
ncbi:hypothetical protein ACOME3_001891 [Neoechinorhynchus agilis]